MPRGSPPAGRDLASNGENGRGRHPSNTSDNFAVIQFDRTYHMGVISQQHASVPMPAGGNDTARHFYGETIGLTESTPPAVLGTERFVWFTIGDSGDEIHVYTDDRGPNSPGQHLCIQVDDPDAIRSTLQANGYD